MTAERISAAGLSLSESHPLSEELSSLRALVTRFQNEAHTSSIKLQRHALDTSAYSERIAQLEAENALLTTELGVLRDNPDPSTPSASSGDTVAELTLSLRRLNAKLSLTETALAEHTQALAETAALATQQTHSAGEAYALAARARGREEEGRLREEALQRALVQAKEETRLSDRVVGEYAALVRTLEGRSPRVAAFPNNLHMEGNVGHSRDTSTSSVGVATGSGGGSSATLVDPTVAASANPKDGLDGAKAQLAALVESFAEQKAALDARAAALEGERDVAQAQLAAANTLSAELGTALAKAKFEREQARVDDRSAAGMVERYMKFTQQTTTSLHSSLASLRARHAATLSTLHSTIASLSARLHASHQTNERLRSALDEAAGAVVRESVGRRREVGVRVRMVGREERVRRGLGVAVGRVPGELCEALREGGTRDDGEKEGEEGKDKEGGDGEVKEGKEREEKTAKALARLVADVRGVLALLDVDLSSPSTSHPPPSPSPSGTHAPSSVADAGTEGRMRVLEDAVGLLVQELEGEVGRRVELEREVRAWEGRERELPLPPVEKDGVVGEDARSEKERPLENGEKGKVIEGEAVMNGAILKEEDAALTSALSSTTTEPDAPPSALPSHGLDAEASSTHDPEPVSSSDSSPMGDDKSEADEETGDEAALEEGAKEGGEDENIAEGRDFVLAESDVVLGEAEQDSAKHEPEIEGIAPSAESEEEDTGDEARGLPEATPEDVATPDAAPLDNPAPTDVPPIDTTPAPSAAAISDSVSAEPPSAVAFPIAVAEPVDMAGTHPISFPSSDAPPSISDSSESTVIGAVAFPPAPVSFPSADALPTALDPDVANVDAPTHPLLADLAATSKRYDALQRAFRDCHLALQELRGALADTSTDGQNPTQAHSRSQSHDAQADVLRSAVERLHDYTEDARVELEIRVADGRVLARGWETIVLLPGAGESSATGGHGNGHAHENADGHAGGDAEAEADVQRQITTCVARDVQAQAAFQHKLEDVEHDIAVLKRAVYAPPSAPSPSLSVSDLAPTLTSPSPVSPKAEGWAAWLGGSASGRRTPPSPGYGEAPTFGSVMTSPRLRHSASAARLATKATHGVPMHPGNPFESLGLRVPMPAYVHQQTQAGARAGRQRTISGVYMLGLGVGHAQGRRPSGLGVPPAARNAIGKGGDEGDVE